MGRLAKITEGKGRHSLSQEVDFINKSLTKVNKSKLKEDRYASLDDELSAIENGGLDMFDNSDLADPYTAEYIKTGAKEKGMSELDYANYDERMAEMEDDWAYEIEDSNYPPIVDFNETPFMGFSDMFQQLKAEMEAEGEVRTGYYAHVCTRLDDLLNETLLMQLDLIEEEFNIGMPFTSNTNAYYTLEKALNKLVPYASDDYPRCKAFYDMLVRMAQEYNAELQGIGNPKWPGVVTIPAVDGALTENSVSNNLPASIDSFLQDVAQMYGGIDYTDIMHFAKKATDAEVKKIQALSRKFKANADDEEAAEGIAKQVASFVKAALTESKVKPSKRALKEHYDVSTIEGLAKYSKDIASAVLDGKLYDSNAVLAICSMLHCNEDYAAECLDSWIETEQIRRSNLHMVPESKKVTKKRVREGANGMTARIYLDERTDYDHVSNYIEIMNEYHPEYQIGCPSHAELKIGGLTMAQAEDILEEATYVGAQAGIRVIKVAFEY